MITALVCFATLGPLGPMKEDRALTRHVADCVRATVSELAVETGVKEEEVAATLVEIGEGKGPFRMGQFRGEEGFYPASVVKTFYLAYAHERMEAGAFVGTPEVERCLRDMIVDSSNEATQAVVDLVTGATGGPELAPADLVAWGYRRDAVNRWFSSKGYRGINVNQKTYGEGPYGREKQFIGPNYERRNKLTSNATARLMVEIMTDQITTPERCEQMRALLKRKVLADAEEADSQSKSFTGGVLPSGSELHSKAGWTSTVRHDMAAVRLPDGRRYVLAIYTKDHAGTPKIVQGLAKRLLEL